MQVETSERILQAASKLFAERGYSNVSIRDVCREGGTTAPVIYYYFGNKRGLFEAVTGKSLTMRGFIEKLERAAEQKSPERGLESFVRTYLTMFPERAFDPGLYMRDSASLDSRSAKMISEDLDKIRSLAKAMINRGIEEGAFRKTNPELAADCLLGMLNRAIFQEIHFSKSVDRETYGNFAVEFFLSAMKPV
ncbi:MAG TPA: TetR/AcrR family transcriptional regulator [Nitrososphaerales archaeon]|nr:TetR/AcrR family transcriptional regulator [Nitrososphaerales archaeon]